MKSDKLYILCTEQSSIIGVRSCIGTLKYWNNRCDYQQDSRVLNNIIKILAEIKVKI